MRALRHGCGQFSPNRRYVGQELFIALFIFAAVLSGALAKESAVVQLEVVATFARGAKAGWQWVMRNVVDSGAQR